MIDLTPTTDRVSQLVAEVRDDQLDAPTPCPQMSVRVLLNHLHGLSIAFRDAARKIDGPTTSGAPDPTTTPLPEDWRDSIRAGLAELAAAWQDPSAWQGMSKAGGQQMPGEVTGLVALDEVTLHGWDLAAATGQSYEVEPEALNAVEQFCAQVPDDPDRSGLFGPRVPVADDAPQLHRVLGLAGRDPDWTAG
ncbi:TIGR03086 family protein [Microlunatus elymi]|uniref:TIGR03086 family protein n=1 Tax=Microlunatus elymi TaxID=2596828 RepID=A0A516PZK2_9ACTN|nr:TIGR03086 family metal-binding protein [Microlunatus elymi]QDP96600.1 TIGR03086 family protein [Microlunatus elymi]